MARKWTKEMEDYGEITNIEDKPAFLNVLIDNWNREYTKPIQVYRLTKEHLGAEFNWHCNWIKKKPIRPYKIIGQFTQDHLLVQRTDTKRYYRMPTKEVAEAFKVKLPLE